jgi:hypothetical protein
MRDHLAQQLLRHRACDLAGQRRRRPWARGGDSESAAIITGAFCRAERRGRPRRTAAAARASGGRAGHCVLARPAHHHGPVRQPDRPSGPPAGASALTERLDHLWPAVCQRQRQAVAAQRGEQVLVLARPGPGPATGKTHLGRSRAPTKINTRPETILEQRPAIQGPTRCRQGPRTQNQTICVSRSTWT